MLTQQQEQREKAMRILQYLVRQWQCVDGTHASDLLDECAEMARDADIATPDMIACWQSEEDNKESL